MVEIKFEKWGNTKIITVRENGKFLTLRRLKGSGIKSKDDAKRIFKENNTLYKDRTKTKINNQTTLRANFIKGQLGGPIAKKKNRKSGQSYFVSGEVKVNRKYVKVAATSFKQGTEDSCMTSQQCHDYAWRKFLGQIGNLVGGSYDADTGARAIDNVRNLREGWSLYE